MTPSPCSETTTDTKDICPDKQLELVQQADHDKFGVLEKVNVMVKEVNVVLSSARTHEIFFPSPVSTFKAKEGNRIEETHTSTTLYRPAGKRPTTLEPTSEL